jgi:hypothetical protein
VDAEPDPYSDLDAPTGTDDAGMDDDWAAFEAVLTAERDPHATVPPVVLAGRRRHDALTLLLRDLTDTEPGTGRPAPTALTVTASLDAVEGRLGALPGTLEVSGGRPVSLRPETLRRMGCYSELTVVLVDALGQPVGVSGTHRSATRKQRAALRALWGPWCAIAGCTSTATVPHHVHPWWLSRQTVLRDLIPICEHDHRAVHEDHRTLRLKDGRLINELGWA